MSTGKDLPIGATKVIAAGTAGKDFLRATVMITPPFSESSAEDDATLLLRWPSTVIRWLKGKDRNFYVQLHAEPVRYAGKDGKCVDGPQRNESFTNRKL